MTSWINSLLRGVRNPLNGQYVLNLIWLSIAAFSPRKFSSITRQDVVTMLDLVSLLFVVFFSPVSTLPATSNSPGYVTLRLRGSRLPTWPFVAPIWSICGSKVFPIPFMKHPSSQDQETSPLPVVAHISAMGQTTAQTSNLAILQPVPSTLLPNAQSSLLMVTTSISSRTSSSRQSEAAERLPPSSGAFSLITISLL